MKEILLLSYSMYEMKEIHLQKNLHGKHSIASLDCFFHCSIVLTGKKSENYHSMIFTVYTHLSSKISCPKLGSTCLAGKLFLFTRTSLHGGVEG